MLKADVMLAHAHCAAPLFIAIAIAFALALVLLFFEATFDRAARWTSGAADLGLYYSLLDQVRELVDAGIAVAALRAMFITGDENEPIGSEIG